MSHPEKSTVDKTPSVEHIRKWEKIKSILHNKEQNTYLYRTPINWVKYIAFIILFTLFVVALFFAFLFGETYVIRNAFKEAPWFPKIQLMTHSYPGLSLVPNIITYIPSPIIWYTSRGSPEPYNVHPKTYIDHLSAYLQSYEVAEKESLIDPYSPYTNCSFTHAKPRKKVCLFKKSRLRFCGQPDYGYREYKPCLLLKLNKLFDWKPVGYNLDKLPKEMPNNLQRLARSIGVKDYIWVSCRGNNPWDTENLGKVVYYPQQGFPSYYFPYDGKKKYISPLVAVQLEGVRRGILLTVVCQIWADNIDHKTDGNNRVYIDIFIDK